MPSIFLSYSTKDNFEAVALHDWLAREGWDDVFFEPDSDHGIAAGERWERALNEAVHRCEAVIFLVSANWLTSPWCRREYTVARALNKKLFAVVIDATEFDRLPEYKGTWQAVDLTGGQDGVLLRTKLPGSHEEKHVVFSKDGLRRLKRGLDKAGLDPKFFAWPPDGDRERAPYRGLKSLEAADAGIFFGRDAPIVEATDKLRGLKSAAPPRLLVILGASGAGKSSFLRAGLWPRLARDDRNFLPLPVIRPERAALTGENGLLAALAAALPHSRAVLRKAIEAGASALRPLLAEFAARIPAAEGEKPPAIVLAIDQAEELFRPEGAAEGAALLALIRDLTREDSPAVIAIFAIRSDGYDALEHAKPLEGFPQTTLPLLPMPRGAYKDVIEGPARRFTEAGGALTIEPQLTLRLLEDIEQGAGSDALPLLAFTLEQLFLDWRREGALRLKDYQDFGGLKGAIDAAVARAFVRADSDPRVPKERSAREALLRRGLIPWLAGIDPDSKSPRRNIARRSEIPAEAAPLIDLLVEERLLSTDARIERDAAGAETRIVTIEPAHEALLRQWGLLEGWLAEDFALLATLEGVKRATRDWQANARAEAWLAHGGQRLAEAQALDASADIAAKLDAADRAYLAACRAKEAAYWKDTAARQEAILHNQAAALAALANIALPRSPAVAAKLALSAWPKGPHDSSLKLTVAIVALGAAVRNLRERITLRGHERPVSHVEFSWDSSRLVTCCEDGTARVWDLATGKTITVLKGHKASVSSARFSRDGKFIVTSSTDKTARIWSATTGDRIAILDGEWWVQNARFSADGQLVVTSSSDGARIWDAVTGRQIAVFGGTAYPADAVLSCDGARIVTIGGHSARLGVWDIATGRTVIDRHDDRGEAAISRDGAYAATSSDNAAHVWDTTTGQLISTLEGHDGRAASVALSPDGARIIITYHARPARVWNTATGRLLSILRGQHSQYRKPVFSDDGSRVVALSDDHAACVWATETGEPIAIFKGHDDRVNVAVFSPDGSRVATASSDRTARVWDGVSFRTLAILKGHEGEVEHVRCSPDGLRILTGSPDRTARIWDAATGHQVIVLEARSLIQGVEFSSDGALIVTASWDATGRVWDATTGESIAVLNGHASEINCAMFSPDRSRVVTASSDGTGRVWDPMTGRLIAVLIGHAGPVHTAMFSPDGSHIVTGCFDTTARIWDSSTAKAKFVLSGHGDQVVSAQYSPDGTKVVTASRDSSARIWNSATGEGIAVLNGHEDPVTSAAFSTDGTLVATGSSDKTARVWDAITGRTLAVCKGHSGEVCRAVFSPDGERILTASLDSSARLWDVATGQCISVFTGHRQQVNSVTFSPDGSRVVTASADKTARIWDISYIPKGNIFQIACAWLPDHDLTGIAREYGLTNLEPICKGDPPSPDWVGK